MISSLRLLDFASNVVGSKSVVFTSVSSPTISGSVIGVSDSVTKTTDIFGNITASLLPTTYQVSLAKPEPETLFYLDSSGSVISASIITGSACTVIFDMEYIDFVPFGTKKIAITPQDNYPSYFSGSLIVLASSSSKTDDAGNMTVDDFVPGIYLVECYGKSTTSFYISVPSDGNTWFASQLICVKPSKAVKIKVNDSDASFCLTVSASDARYGFINGNHPTASYSFTSSYATTASIIPFDGNRPIKRSGYTGVIPGGDDLKAFIERFFYPFIPATVAIANGGNTYYEVGTSQDIVIASTITLNDAVTFGSGSVLKSGVAWNDTTVPVSSSFSYTDTGLTTDATYVTKVQVNSEDTPTIITSNTKTATFIYPYLYGMSFAPNLSGATLYNSLTKNIIPEGDVSVNMLGNATYIWFCYPATYGPLTTILDPNLFNIFGLFTYSNQISVTSTGLANNWTTDYRVYRTSLVSDPSGQYQFRL